MYGLLTVIIMVYNLPKGVKQGCVKWTLYAIYFTQECMTNHKNPKSRFYNILLVLQEILPAHLDSHLGTDCLWLCSGNASSSKYQAKHM